MAFVGRRIVGGVRSGFGTGRRLGNCQWLATGAVNNYLFIPKDDREEMIDLHFSDPEKYTVETLAAGAGVPECNVRGMLKLAYMEKSLKDVITSPTFWNIEKEVIEVESGEGEEGGERRTKVVYKRRKLTALEKNGLGKITKIPAFIGKVAKLWKEKLAEPSPKASLLTKPLTNIRYPRYVMYDTLKAESREKKVEEASKTLQERSKRLRKIEEIARSAAEINARAIQKYPWRPTGGWRPFNDQKFPPPPKMKPTYVCMDISKRLAPDERPVWVFETRKKKRREATEEERERMILSQLKRPYYPTTL